MICVAESLRAIDACDRLHAGRQSRYVDALSQALVGLGHEVEIWTVRGGGDDQPAAEQREAAPIIRRFPGQRENLVPRVRPCGWVSEWVACATAHLERAPGVVATLVTHHWEAGVAGRSLAERFGLAQVHVPHVPQVEELDDGPCARPEAQNPATIAWQVDEDRETCQVASAVIATSASQRDVLLAEPYCAPAARVAVVDPGPGMGRRFLAALPPAPECADPIPLASIGVLNAAAMHTLSGRRPPWCVDVDVVG